MQAVFAISVKSCPPVFSIFVLSFRMNVLYVYTLPFPLCPGIWEWQSRDDAVKTVVDFWDCIYLTCIAPVFATSEYPNVDKDY